MANRIPERAEFDENIDIGDHDELFIQGTLGSSVSLLCYLGQEFQYFERFSYLRLCSSVRCASIYSLTVSMETEPVVWFQNLIASHNAQKYRESEHN